jgi:type IV pilus assembly protein PilW
MNHRIPTLPRSGQRGVTLIELMVGMAIGLIVLAGLAVMFANSSRVGRELESTSRQIENGRYVVDLLAQELAVAGYYGEVPADSAVYTNPGACATALADLGWDNDTKKRPSPMEGKTVAELAALTCATYSSSTSPAVVLRRLETTTTPQASVNDSAGIAYVQTSQCNDDTAATAYVVAAQKSAFTLRNLACTAASDVRRYITRLYYVASCNECTGSAADKIPTLKRAELTGNTITVTPLASGIEHIALEYGFDTNNDGIPELYRTALSGVAGAADNKWENVVTARIYVLARTDDEAKEPVPAKSYVMGLHGTLGPYNDKYKRKLFVTTAKLQNVAGPRER